MQAGLTRRRLTFREIFETGIAFLASKNVLFALFKKARPVSFPIRGVPLAIDDGSTDQARLQIGKENE